MVKKTETIITLTDDLDGTRAERTVTFTIDGATYEIDLSKKNVRAFEKAIAPYVDAARKAPRVARARTAGRRSATRTNLGEIRAWAKANGRAVSERGRIPSSILEAFDAAQ